MRHFNVKWPKCLKDGSGHAWIRVGYATEQSDGKILMTLDTIPIAGFDGTLVLFPDDEETRASTRGRRRAPRRER